MDNLLELMDRIAHAGHRQLRCRGQSLALATPTQTGAGACDGITTEAAALARLPRRVVLHAALLSGLAALSTM